MRGEMEQIFYHDSATCSQTMSVCWCYFSPIERIRRGSTIVIRHKGAGGLSRGRGRRCVGQHLIRDA